MDKRQLIIIGTLFVASMLLFGKNPLDVTVLTPTDAFNQAMESKLSEQHGYANLSSYMSVNSAGYTNGNPYMGSSGAVQGVLRGPGGMPINNMPHTNNNYAGYPPQSKKSDEPQGHQVPSFFLNDGRRIFFSGYNVLVLALDGSVQPLPDGSYKLQTGDMILIKDGKRVAPEK